ncbi:mitochondrial amidoxime reducing component 2-like [Ylistrum balloti]|uniref:mitochondrial amidoxime reducing component 2-like n=1 Tax=Ylistrum balloti TaxID=509963 RepID=UPI002905DDAB|nr:mitochondrial amidoxime reducing component 2-like [Ylistrum balloti]
MLSILRDDATSTFVGLIGASVLKYGFTTWLASGKPRVYEKVGKVSSLHLYPVKSCRGLDIETAECTAIGLRQFGVTDRHWILSSKVNNWINANMEPKLTLVTVKLHEDMVEMTAPGMEPLLVPLNPKLDQTCVRRIGTGPLAVDTLDCGDEAADWFTKHTGRKGVRLNYSHPDMSKRESINFKYPWEHNALPGDRMAFSYYCAFMMMTKESLNALNAELETPANVNNFRPNIMMEGSPAFEEDNWDAVKIGTTSFRMIDMCSRCNQINIVQEEGKRSKDKEPFSTLRRIRSFPKYGGKPCIGIYLAPDVEGTVSVGDDVYAIRK